MAKKVLIVDDDPPLLEAVEMALASEGFEILKASNGARCMQVVAEDSPDLVVLDINMPVMDGLQVLRVLRENRATRNLPVIVLTARDEDLAVKQAWETGIDFYITKPFDIGELKLVVHRALEAREPDAEEAD